MSETIHYQRFLGDKTLCGVPMQPKWAKGHFIDYPSPKTTSIGSWVTCDNCKRILQAKRKSGETLR